MAPRLAPELRYCRAACLHRAYNSIANFSQVRCKKCTATKPMRHLQTFRLIESVTRAGSIRRAAEDMSITASALNRRIRNFEEEFGCEIFERLPKASGCAGELLLQHIRGQISDLARVQSQVADLTGVRRGHVSVACSQALLPYFLPAQIAAYRSDHPGVTFSVNVRDRQQAEQELSNYSSDIALVFDPLLLVDFELLMAVAQPVCVAFAHDHPLAKRRSCEIVSTTLCTVCALRGAPLARGCDTRHVWRLTPIVPLSSCVITYCMNKRCVSNSRLDCPAHRTRPSKCVCSMPKT